MSITKSGIVNIFTSNTQQYELEKQMKKFKKVKALIERRKSQMFLNRQQTGHSKKSIQEQTKQKDTQGQSKRLQKFRELTDHLQTLQALKKKYTTDFSRGLSDIEAMKRLKQQGENVLTQKNKTPQVLLYLKQMSDPFSLLLWLLTVLSFIYFGITQDSNGICLVGILLIVLFGGASIQYAYNKNTSQTIDSIKSIVPLYCTVIRDGQEKSILVSQLVKGDMVVIMPGLKIPADLRIIQCNGLRSDNSIYTGQSKNVVNTVQTNNQTNPFVARNMMFFGVVNVQGTGKGLVINTGNNNLFSEISQLLLSEEPKPKFIQAQIQRFVIVVTIFSLGVGVFTFFGGYLTGFRVIIAVMIAIGDCVACVPGVLNLEVTVMFTLAIKKLRKRNIICKDLFIIQNLGSTSCLCTDKTGTLTKNQQTVSEMLIINNRPMKCVNVEEFGPNYAYDYDWECPIFKDIQRCAILTSIAKFESSPLKRDIQNIYSRKDLSREDKIEEEKKLRTQWNLKIEQLRYSERPMTGNAVEIALTHFFQPIKDITFLKEENPFFLLGSKEIALKTFKSEDKYSMSINKNLQDGHYYIYCKGAPQTIWNFCRYVQLGDPNKTVAEKQNYNAVFEAAVQSFADQGQTVIAFSKMKFTKPKDSIKLKISPPNFQHDEQIFLGMISLQDPPKKGVPDTIEKIRVAGIKVVMITGDQQKIATKVAKLCNIFTEPKTVNEIMKEQQLPFEQAFTKSESLVITGNDIDKILASDEYVMIEEKQRALMRLLDKKQVVLARSSPSHKMFVVSVLQKMGHMVTVTGDGTNDSTALKIANCGICMGSGTDIAKDCADIIIADDDFNKILEGIEEGRKIFDNLKKAIVYVMTSQISEFMPFVLLIFSRIPIPIFTLLIDAPVDFVPTISYVYEQGEVDIMTRKPKDLSSALINGRLLGQASGWNGFSGFLCCLTCYYVCMIDFGFIPLELWDKNSMPLVLPSQFDTYNPTDPHFGNSALKDLKTCAEFHNNATTTDFINSMYPWVDIRMSSVLCEEGENGTAIYKPIMQYGQCRVQQISIYTHKPVCYTSESTKYGQTAYMYGNVICQVFNLFMCKSSKQSCFSMRFDNKVMVIGLTLELAFALALSEMWPLIYLIGTRDNVYMHYGLPGLLFGLIQFTIDEVRKWLMRTIPRENFGDKTRSFEECKPNWFERNTKW